MVARSTPPSISRWKEKKDKLKPEKIEAKEINTSPLRLIIAILEHMSAYEGFGEVR